MREFVPPIVWKRGAQWSPGDFLSAGGICALSLCLAVALAMGCQPTDPSPVEDVVDVEQPDAPDTPDMSERVDQETGPDMQPDLPNRPTVTVATYNVRRFFDTICDSNRCDDGDFEAAPSEAEYNFRLGLVADALDKIDADLLILQEIETEDALATIVDRVGLQGGFAQLGETGGAGSLDVAVIGRGNLLEVHTHGDRVLTRPNGSRTSFSREFLEVHVEYEGRRVILFSAHFKAKRNDDPDRRFLEAEAAHDIVAEVSARYPDALTILGGDLNDEPGSAPMSELTNDQRFHLVSEDREPNDVWTYQYFSDRVAIDHLILVADGDGAYVPGSANAVRDASGGLGGSDHAALRAEFYL